MVEPRCVRTWDPPSFEPTSSQRANRPLVAGPRGLLIADVVTASHGAFIFANDFLRRAVLTDLASIDPDSASAQTTNLIHLVAHEQNRPALRDVAHLAEAFLLERSVADGEDFVHEQDFGLEMRGDGEGEAHLHAAAVVLQGGVEEAFHFGEGYDLVELAADFAARMPRMAPLMKTFSRPVSSG